MAPASLEGGTARYMGKGLRSNYLVVEGCWVTLRIGSVEQVVVAKCDAIAPFLDERQRRLWLGVEARAQGRGGVSATQMMRSCTATARRRPVGYET